MPQTKRSVTIKDIAQLLGISTATVHRALAKKPGVGVELSERIWQCARDLGYRANYAASAIKSGLRRVALVLPFYSGQTAPYFDYIWSGCRRAAQELRLINIEVQEWPCECEEEQLEILESFARMSEDERPMGVVSFCFTDGRRLEQKLEALAELGLRILVIDSPLERREEIYHLSPEAPSMGELAADFLSLCCPDEGSVLVSVGRSDSGIHRQKLEYFCRRLALKKPGLRVLPVGGYDPESRFSRTFYETCMEALDREPAICACYAMTSYDNRGIAEAVWDSGRRKTCYLVGVDLSTDTRDLLHAGKLDAVINQGAFAKGYHGLRNLGDALIRNKRKIREVRFPIDLILPSNLRFYEHRSEEP